MKATLLQVRVVGMWAWFKVKVVERKAEPWLAALSFAESFLIPFPVDPFLAAMVLADRSRYLWLATVATVSSSIGAGVGYLIGFFAFDYIGAWFAAVSDKSVFVTKMTALFSDHALILTFGAALTPIPNAPVVIAAGFVATNFMLFIVSWTVARSIRFFGVAYIVHAFGADSLSRSERAINIGSVIIAILILATIVYRATGL